MIIDSHLHISNFVDKNDSFLTIKDKLLSSMQNFKIDYSIVIPDNMPNTTCADMTVLDEIISREERLFMMGTINIFKNIDEQIVILEKLMSDNKICAVKLFPGHDPFFPTDSRCDQVYELCDKYDKPVVVHTGINTGDEKCAQYNDPKYLLEISQLFPRLKIVIAHFFWPRMQYCFDITKDNNNIYYDTSGMADPEVVELTGGWQKVIRILKKTVKFKPDHVIFGTDWPMCPVEKHIQLFKDLKLEKSIQDKIFYKNAINLYKLNI